MTTRRPFVQSKGDEKGLIGGGFARLEGSLKAQLSGVIMNRKKDLLVFIAAAQLRKLELREETIGHGPSKEKWEAWNPDRRGN